MDDLFFASSNDDLCNRAIEREVERVLESLDRALTREYCTAKELFPELVRQETKIRDFLKKEKNDPVLAANRLARYWKTRSWLFEER